MIKALVYAVLAVTAWWLMVLLLGLCHVDDNGWPRLGVVAAGVAAFVLGMRSVESWRCARWHR